ncbi:MAG: hypothetical protein ACOYNC_10565 [Bacteroidales bacterium]
MKTTKRYKVKSDKIHSLQDLSMEKQRLRMEIMKTEASIHSGYRDVLNALTFKNIANSMISDISTSSTILTKVLSFGNSFLSKRRKKKQEKLKENPDASGS